MVKGVVAFVAGNREHTDLTRQFHSLHLADALCSESGLPGRDFRLVRVTNWVSRNDPA